MTKIFLDSGDPAETREAIAVLGHLDGQTTNPSLISKSPGAKGKKFTNEEAMAFYKNVVTEISQLIPDGSVSIEVYANKTTPAEELFTQGKEMFTWIPNAHIKYPITVEGLKAARMSVDAGMRVNMTLCFSLEQAAAVYAATVGAKPGDVYLSPFIGRLDDQGEDGLNFLASILSLYADSDKHVQVLAASIRTINHLLKAVNLGSDIVTAPLAVLRDFAKLRLTNTVESFDISSKLTDSGIDKFVADWAEITK